MNPKPGMPRILLVEDDPVSRAYLVAATRGLPADVDAAGSVAEALAIARDRRHDLWLFDAHLPDGSGAGLLSELRVTGTLTPALAHTATRDRNELDALIAAGFAEVLVKPIESLQWQASLRRALGTGDGAIADQRSGYGGKLPVWDDHAASTALAGNDTHIAALRALFIEELPRQRDAIRTGDAGTRCRELHRLRASCGFTGAARLSAAVVDLQEAAGDDRALQRFLHAVEDTLA